MMELDMATVEKRRYRKSKEHKKVEESHSDGDFDKLFNNISFEIKEDNEIDEMFGDITRGNFFNEVEEHERFKEEEEFAKFSSSRKTRGLLECSTTQPTTLRRT